MAAAYLQIFMTNTASHCKGMWNLCVILALKNNLFCVDAAPNHIPSLLTENHMAATFTLISICLSFQDLLRKMEECWGKVVRFLQFQHWGRSLLAPSWRSFDRSPEKERYWDFSTFWSERAAAWHLWGKCLSFGEKWKLWHLWPTYLPQHWRWAINCFWKKKEQKHFSTFSLLSPFDFPAHAGEVKNSAGAFGVQLLGW